MKSLISDVFKAESTEDLGYSLGKTTHSVKAKSAFRLSATGTQEKACDQVAIG